MNNRLFEKTLRFVRNLLDSTIYYDNNNRAQDIIEYFIHSSDAIFINKVYLDLRSRFSKVEVYSLNKLLMVHFFKYTETAQRIIEPIVDYADHFVSFMPIKGWQTALEFRALSNLIPSISVTPNPLNPKIRNDVLFLMKMINGLESTDPEIFESAKDALQKLGRKIPTFQNIYLQCIKMPFLLLFLPDMTSDSNLINQVISVYNSLFQLFMQARLKSEAPENPENEQQLVPVDNQFENPFENENSLLFLQKVLISIVQFIRNLKVFPRNLFSSFIDLFHSLIPDPNSETEINSEERNCSREACILIFDCFSCFPEYLRPYQVHIISDIAVNFILNLPPVLDTSFSTEENQRPYIDTNSIEKVREKFLKSPLKMLSRFNVTDMRLTPIPPIDTESASLLVSVFPRPSESSGTNNSTYADQVVKIFLPFQSSTFSVSTCRLFLRHLIDFIPYLSEEAHSIIIEVLLPNLMKQGPTHQELIALFLSSISFLTNPDLLSLYLIFVSSFPDGVAVTPKLKAVALSLFYLASRQPDEQFAKITVAERYDCGKQLFLIGEYSQPAVLWGPDCGDPSSSSVLSSAEAFKIVALAEVASNMKDHARAAHEFIKAANAFELTSFAHDFHMYYLKARYLYEAIVFQADLMHKMVNSGGYGQIRKESISETIIDIEELAANLKELLSSSLLLHPRFDAVSLSYVREFIEIAKEMVAAIDKDADEFQRVVNNRKIVPPPAILSTEQPITVEGVRIVNPDIEIKNSVYNRQFYLELRGKVVFNLKIFNDGFDIDGEVNDDRKADRNIFEVNKQSEILNELGGCGGCGGCEVTKNLNTLSFPSNYASRGVDWCRDNEMKLMCDVSIPINGQQKVVHTQEIPIEGEFSVDFPIVAEYKNACSQGCKSDSGHNMRVTIFFTAVFEEQNSHYRIGREDRYVYIHEV